MGCEQRGENSNFAMFTRPHLLHVENEFKKHHGKKQQEFNRSRVEESVVPHQFVPLIVEQQNPSRFSQLVLLSWHYSGSVGSSEVIVGSDDLEGYEVAGY
ncbi:hypothetical protein ACH5RR_009178 [Cinchona calisaya]|uniref:Uncharacterized protein n=1 Tax=Cinchona calisaya TaxID=153742 RepID=A0ABD3AFW1_9GENT